MLEKSKHPQRVYKSHGCCIHILLHSLNVKIYSIKEIKNAYRKIERLYYPNINSEPKAIKNSKKSTVNYEKLLDDKRRVLSNQYCKDGVKSNAVEIHGYVAMNLVNLSRTFLAPM